LRICLKISRKLGLGDGAAWIREWFEGLGIPLAAMIVCWWHLRKLEWVRNPPAVEELIGYLEKRRAYIPDYQQRQRAGLWIASTRVEKYNDWVVSDRCKHRGMSWSPQGVLALAALEAARRNGELDRWRQDRELPRRELPEPVRKVA